ncbi:hypothetical protein CPB83DRAFT_843977 [Crepidotus variabilis]|uniref:Zn(2)-C6 fungal-type domain-containing protein n=1 Tax=Crepidotus variabilis TaxID=179855 RepID=A0A9P6ES64_9AGAR|nr:hypothetical protein CPB83DRAFT_843977 [Crepidotus variabilis]
MSMVKNSDYPSPDSEPLGKRKKLDDDFSNGPLKKQRTRVSFSCGECHRRKQKCDRQVPCSHCVARKVPELCKAYTPGKADQDLNARVTRLEQIIEMALPPQFLTPGASTSSLPAERNHVHHNHHRTSPNIDDDSKSQPEDQDPSSGTFLNGKWYGPSVSGSIAPGSLIEQIEHVAGPDARSEGNSTRSHSEDKNGASSSPQTSHLASGVSSGDDLEQAAVDNLQRLVQECGVTPQKISELLQELPEIGVSDQLIDFYFSSINWTRYPISENDFRAAYDSICGCIRGRGTASNPQDIRFLPLLCVVLAISARLAPEHLAGDARSRRATSLRYYWTSRRALLIAAAVQPDSLDMVLTRLLSARFLTFDRRITECWSQLGAAVRTAQALGLHRDGASIQGMPQGTVEYRRRIWSYLLHADRSYALVLGRPNSIQDAYTSTKPPSNMDGEPHGSQSLDAFPLTRPTPMTYVILRHQLAEIIGRMVHHFQQVRERSHYSEVTSLDDELLGFIKHLPPHYSLQPDTSLDQLSPYIPVHRFMLITEILFVRISLHRPYLLRRVHSDRYARSRNACFESAIKDFEVRQAFRETTPQEVRDSLGNSYREFQSAMISGIYFILEPKGPHSDAMHVILDGFVKDHEEMKEMDETTKRELKTIAFLKNKASQMTALGIHPRRTKGHEDSFSRNKEQQAQLLLSLGKPVASPSIQSQMLLSGAMKDHSPSPHSPPLPRSVAQSPTLSRLQYTSQPHSPTTSGSPHADDDSSAQTLLDTWYNSFSTTAVDPSSGGALPWPGYIGPEMMGWPGNAFPGTGNSNLDPRLLASLDGSDTAYLEALVNQIHADTHRPS